MLRNSIERCICKVGQVALGLMTVLTVVLFVSGCGGSGRSSLSGTIMVNGVPIESGSITFTPMEGTHSSAVGAAITNGAYHIDANKGPLPGDFKVQISASGKTGKKIREPGTGKELDEMASIIPAKYESLRGGQEAIKYTVTSGKNEFSMDLTD